MPPGTRSERMPGRRPVPGDLPPCGLDPGVPDHVAATRPGNGARVAGFVERLSQSLYLRPTGIARRPTDVRDQTGSPGYRCGRPIRPPLRAYSSFSPPPDGKEWDEKECSGIAPAQCSREADLLKPTC